MENEITGFHAAQRFIEPQNYQRFVSTPKLFDIADVLDVSVDRLFDFKD